MCRTNQQWKKLTQQQNKNMKTEKHLALLEWVNPLCQQPQCCPLPVDTNHVDGSLLGRGGHEEVQAAFGEMGAGDSQAIQAYHASQAKEKRRGGHQCSNYH